MREYHKIQTVYFRDPATNNKALLEGQWSMPEFGYLADRPWTWTEKVDGTNIRVGWNQPIVRFAGKTDEADIPGHLLRQLEAMFTPDVMRAAFPASVPMEWDQWITLYGEGYGAKIQKAGPHYMPDRSGFILFDVNVAGLWLERHNVEDIAGKLGIPVVPIAGTGTLHEAIESAKAGYSSAVAEGRCKAEGYVMRPAVELMTRRGERIVTKIKSKDFR